MLPKHNDFLECILLLLVVLKTDVAGVLTCMKPSGDGRAKMSQRPVEVMVQQTGSCFKQGLKKMLRFCFFLHKNVFILYVSAFMSTNFNTELK